MKNRMLIILLTLVIAIPSIASAQYDKKPAETTKADPQKQTGQSHNENSDASKKIASATEVISDFSRMKEGPPTGLVQKAAAVVVIPNLLKAGLVAGGKHGEGVLTMKDAKGNWSEPVFINLSGGSVGFQAGVSSTDLVLLLMRERDIDQILDGEFTLSGEAAVAAGPVGRDANAGTDAHFDAPIYSYSRSKGVFAGISVEGSKLYQDKSENQSFYGNGYDAHALMKKTPSPNTPAAQLAQALNALTGKTQASTMGGTSGSQ
jgi:lipid-binding SYLF domain-containing protein